MTNEQILQAVNRLTQTYNDYTTQFDEKINLLLQGGALADAAV